MKMTLLRLLLPCALLLALPGSLVYSQSDSSHLEKLSLKELLNIKVTTASKTLQALGVTPATVKVITKQQIKTRGYQSLLDILYDLPDFKVDDKVYSGIRNSITIRGTQGSEKLVIMLDGTIISSPSGEAMPVMENYPVNLAEQVEVVYGPASSLYGANAVSGIINIITQKDSPAKKLLVQASSLAGTYGYTNSTLLVKARLGDNTTLTVSGQYFYDRQPDYSKLYNDDAFLDITSHKTGTFNTIYGPITPVTPVRPVFEAPMEAYNLYASLQTGNFTFSFFRNQFRLPNALGNNTHNTVYNKEVYMGQSISTLNAAYKKVFNRLTTTTMLTASEYAIDPRSNYRNLYSAMEPGYKYGVSSMIKAEEMLTWQTTDNFSVTAGAGYENFYTIPQSADLRYPVNKKEAVAGSYLGTESYYRPEGLPAQFYFIRFQNISSYIQAQYSPASSVNLTIGARYDRNSRFGSTFNPRAGIVYTPSEKTTVKLLYGSAFLAPSPSTTYVQYGSFNTQDSGRSYHSWFLHLPNPGLKPIRSQNAEISIRQYISDNLSITADGYYTALSGLYAFADDNASTRLYQNMFNGIPVDYIEVFINQDKQRNYGGSLQVNWKYNLGSVQMNSYASFSYVNGVIKNGADQSVKDIELDFIAHGMMRLGTDIQAGKFSASPRLLIMGSQHIAGIEDATGPVVKRQSIPGYELLNISLRYEWKKGIALFSNITNALNQEYKAVGFNMDLQNSNTDLFYGQPQEPVRVMAGFQFNF